MPRLFAFYCLPLFLLLIHTSQLAAQETPETLTAKYESLIQTSETYDVYKVIRINRIQSMWAEVEDTLSHWKRKNTVLSQQISSAEGELEEKAAEVEQLTAELQQTKKITSTISFLGINFEKESYHLMVWAIILVLLAVAISVFVMHQRNFQVTKLAKDELEKSQLELEDYRSKAREKQLKVKRELQTALNQLEELKKKR